MSGITGICRFGDSVDRGAVTEMTAALDHRGPDGNGVVVDGMAGLGHQQFCTTPEAKSVSPPLERNGRILTADVRIDNRAELLSTLPVEGPPGRISDEEVVLAAYERWGKACPEHLVGAYAFAVWDAAEEHVFAARDHIGLRPFYYYHDGERFAFASEVKGLWPLDAVSRAVDERRLSTFLAGYIMSNERTFYEDVASLPPAYAMTVSADGVDVEEYWRLDPDRKIRLGSDEAYAERFRELFTEAVRARLRTVGPVASTLSGGLDSSSVVTTARELLDADDEQSPVRTYSAVFDRAELPKSDEREHIEAVLEGGDVTSEFFRGDEMSPLVDVEEVFWHNESPSIGNNFYLTREIHRRAGADGIRTVLDGVGGDSTVSHGLRYLPELATNLRWFRLFGEVCALSERFGDMLSVRELVVGRTLAPLLPAFGREALVRYRNDGLVEALNPALDEAFAERTNVADRLLEEMVSQKRTQRGQHHDTIQGEVITAVVERQNKTAAQFQVEPRFPFLDRRLMEFCLALPPDQKLRDGWTRYVERTAMEGRLPESVRWRGGKGNLGPSFWTALRNEGDGTVERALLADERLADEFVDFDYVASKYDEFRRGDTVGLGELWYPTLLELWLREEPTPQRPPT